MTTTTISFPWDTIPPSMRAGEYSCRKVRSSDNPQHINVFWARSWENRPAFVVDYDLDSWRQTVLPSFKCIEVIDHKENSCMTLELIDDAFKDIFMKLCLDIVSFLQNIPATAARHACVLRLERWSSLLKPSRAKLSDETQKGLIAELAFLQDEALEALNASDALKGWVGPEEGPRDFTYGQTFIEVKSKRSSANPNISISSEDQLSCGPNESIFLYVMELNNAPAESVEGITLAEAVDSARAVLDSPIDQALFDAKLSNVGYFDEDDYSDEKWTKGEIRYYVVNGDFPKIDSSSCPNGVSRVNYQIDLNCCDEFQTDKATVRKAMVG